MIDIWDVFFNALWIVGLSVILAVWSYARYTARVQGVRLRDKLNILKYALVLNCGLLLFLAGMSLTEDRWFVKVLWVLLGIGVLVESGFRIKQHKQRNMDANGQ
jgi:hypothetical protein